MSDFGQYLYPVGRKEHRCEYCWWRIPQGEKYAHFSGKFEGDFQDWRMHMECYDEFNNSGEDYFSPGESDPPKRIHTRYSVAEKALSAAPEPK